MFSFTSGFDEGASSRCPADFNRQDYARGIQQERLRATVTVTAAAFSPCGGYLVCSSDLGRLAVWELAPYMDRGAFSTGEVRDTTPHLSFQADGSCINHVTFAEEFLLCGGDESLFGWPWSEILSALLRGSPPTGAVNDDEGKRGDGVKYSPPLRVRCPQARTRRGAFSPYPEINDIVFDKMTGRVLCAAGDGNAYEWDMRALATSMGEVRDVSQAPVQTYRGRRGYLHAVASAPGCSFVATGSEDGSVGIWDRRVNNDSDGANATFLKPTHVKAGDGNEGSPREGVGSDGEAWVSSLEMDEGGHTLVCAGGRGGRAESTEADAGRGWVNQWNLAALTAMSVASIPAEGVRADCQLKCLYGSASVVVLTGSEYPGGNVFAVRVQCLTVTDEGQTLLVGGAEGSVTYLSRSRLETRARTPTCSPSLYALAVNATGPHEGITCLAGVGPVVAICTLPGIVSFTLCFV